MRKRFLVRVYEDNRLVKEIKCDTLQQAETKAKQEELKRPCLTEIADSRLR